MYFYVNSGNISDRNYTTQHAYTLFCRTVFIFKVDENV